MSHTEGSPSVSWSQPEIHRKNGSNDKDLQGIVLNPFESRKGFPKEIPVN